VHTVEIALNDGLYTPAVPQSRKGTTLVLRLEGYEYDLSADYLTARVVRVGPPGTRAERASLEIPITFGLKRLIQGTLTLLTHAIAARTPAEAIDGVERDGPGPAIV
jgi:hypothetical protein